jgi:hypothetical protein
VWCCGADAPADRTFLIAVLMGAAAHVLLQVVVDERGAVALMHLLEHTPTLQQLDLCR